MFAAIVTAALTLQALEGRPTVAEIMESAPESVWITPSPEDTLYLETETGRVVIALVPELSPAHAAQARILAREGYYDGLDFYRVPIGFVAQGGDATGEKDKGSAAQTLPAEFEAPMPNALDFTPLGMADGYAPVAGFIKGLPAGYDPDAGTAWLAHCTGAFAYGRENGRDTASTEFYITLQPQRYLDRNLTVLGRVIHGIEHIQALPRGAFGNFGTIEEPAARGPILGMTVAADVPADKRTSVQVMDTGTETFRALIGARAARPSAFFYHRANHVDLCQMPVPTRMTPE